MAKKRQRIDTLIDAHVELRQKRTVGQAGRKVLALTDGPQFQCRVIGFRLPGKKTTLSSASRRVRQLDPCLACTRNL